MRLFDITHPVSQSIAVWPGDSPFSQKWITQLREGGTVNLSTLNLSTHTGTHADAFYHINELTQKIEEMPLEIYIGNAQIITIGSPEAVQLEDVKKIDFDRVKRVLFKTSTNADPEVFNEDFAYISLDAAYHLAEKQTILVGIDTPSVDPFDSKKLDTHQVFIRGKIGILEGLNLENVSDGIYELMAFPLKIVGGDASPVRAVLRETDADKKFVDDMRSIWEDTFDKLNF